MSTIGSINTGSINIIGLDALGSMHSGGGIEAGESLLPTPSQFASLGGDPGSELARLVLESATEDKKAGRKMRAAEEAAQSADENRQLEAMADKAGAKLASGFIGGFSTVASGAISFAGASPKDADAMKARGTASAADGAGKLGATFFDHQAEMDERRATQAEQMAGRHKRAADDARDTVDDASSLIDRTIAFYKEFTTAQADTQKAALLRA